MIKVNVIIKDNSWLNFIKYPNLYLKKKLKKIQNDKPFFRKKKYSFSVLLSNTTEIKLLNKKFRKKNKSTDILSFPNQTKKDFKKNHYLHSKIYLGDIIINYKKINSTSVKKFQNQFDILWIHGLLHLFGYEHKKNKDYKKMNIIEKKFLKKII